MQRKLKSLLTVVLLLSVLSGRLATAANTSVAFVNESERRLPIACRVDVAVIGGSTAAVSAATAAAEQGASVFLAAPRTYLGEDMCGTLRLSLQPGQEPRTELARKIFDGRRETTPMRVKKVLDRALLDAGVKFLFGCYATEALRDAEGRIRGFVMANRAGRQAVIAKTVIDASNRAWFTRLTGAKSEPWPGGERQFKRTLILPAGSGESRAVTKRVSIPMSGRSYEDFARAEQIARDRTYEKGQLRSSEFPFQVPPDPIVCRRRADEWQKGSPVSVAHFRPEGTERLFVLSGCADVPRDVARRLLRPAGLTEAGRQIGASAAETAERAGPAEGIHVSGSHSANGRDGDIREALSGLRPVDGGRESLRSASRSVPVLCDYDVVVIGGGTSGAPAAIAAGRQGASILVVEYQAGLGGTGTLGMIGRPYHGRKAGFSREVPFPGGDFTIADKMEWYRQEIRKVDGDIWFRTLGGGVYVKDGQVRGAVVATPQGRGVVRAEVVIDSTGNADIAAAAGAETIYGASEDGRIAMQGAGLPKRPLRKNYVNTDYLFVDESDMMDVWSTLVGARSGMKGGPFDAGPLLQTRERRRIVGEHVLRYLDQIAGRTYPDSVVYSGSDYDSHGYPNEPYFALIPHTEKSNRANHPAPGGECYTPYRCLLPKGVEGMLVTGLGISMERDATAMVRMQHDIANQGYAAGIAAAMALREDTIPREIDVDALQQHLAEVGNLPEDALKHKDSFPLPESRVAEAVERMASKKRNRACRALAIVMSHREAALPYVREAYEDAEGHTRLRYAKLLGFWGDRRVVPDLIEALENSEWDKKILQGRMAEYAHLPTPVDALVLALGHAKHTRALPVIFEKMESLDSSSTLSHHRAVALALERIGDPAAGEPLARLLQKPGMSGHVMTKPETLHRTRGKRKREGALREIVLARALYRCGDHENRGERILNQYTEDLRGLLARHAAHVLKRSGDCDASRR